MADIWTNQAGNAWCPQMHLVVSLKTGADGYDDLDWYADYVAHGTPAYTNGIARTWNINIDGQTRSGTININGVKNTVRLGSGTIRVNKQHAYRNIRVECSINLNVTWAGSYIDWGTASGTHPIGAKPSYTVSYNANGGSGAPGNQTKWYGENLTLSDTRPTRTGHNFSGWATSASGGVAYQPGATYSGNAALSLFAKWAAHTYTVSYNANGGSGAPGNQTKTYGQTLKLSTTIPKRTNYNFKGWGTSAGSTSVTYAAGANYTNNSAITLYAVWELAWLQPRITNLQATRCDSAGTLKEDGQYAKVTFNWATDRTVSAIKIVCNGVTVNGSGSGTSGSVSLVIGNNALSTESSYTVTVTVADAVGSDTMSTTVAPMYYLMDINGHGNGIAFGMPATVNNALVTNMYTWNKKGVNFTNRLEGSTGTAGGWHKLGTISSSYDSAITVIDVYSGNGYNAGTSQNTWFKLFIKDGWQQTTSSTSAFACTVYMYTGPWDGFNVQIRASSHSMCDVWVQLPWAYWAGDYTVTTSARWTPAPANWQSSAPTVGVTQSVAYWSMPLMRKDGAYYGFATPEGNYAGGDDWIRTTSAGLIPYQAGGASGLGTSRWPFNNVYTKNIHINNSRIADHVVASGTSGIWRYIKWNNGAAECWARELSVANANGFFAISGYNYPFNIYDASAVVSLKDHTHTSNTTHNMAFMDRNNTKVDVKIASDTGGIDNLGQKKIDVHIKGRWK